MWSASLMHTAPWRGLDTEQNQGSVGSWEFREVKVKERRYVVTEWNLWGVSEHRRSPYLDESLTWEARVTCAEQGERLLAGRGRWVCSDPLQKLHLHQQGHSSSGRTLGASSMWAAQDLGKTKKILGVRNLLIHWNIAYQMALVPSPFSLTITSSYLPWSFFFHAENISPSWTSGAFLYWRYEPPFFQTICSCLDL